ncbi:MAG: hypothetical protein OEW48_01880 [Phycisphaerae bacterium]|nr:hypothetical protein [Phycisphaerae bacterium]
MPLRRRFHCVAEEYGRIGLIIDVKLAQVTAMFLALIIAKLIPDIMDVGIWWFVVLLIICEIRPFYVFCFRE